MNSGFYILLAIASAFWITSMVSGVVSIIWNLLPAKKLAWTPVMMAVYTLFIGFIGMKFIHITYSKKVNGSGWSINSKWFFLATVVLGLIAVALAIWRQFKLNRESQPDQPNPLSDEPPRII